MTFTNKLLILLILFLSTSCLNDEMNMLNSEIKVLFTDKFNIETVDPAKIHFITQYFILKNLYSTLIELDQDNLPVSGVAESFKWKNNHLELKIRSNLKTTSGYTITAKDVKASLLRHILLNNGTHNNLIDLLGIESKVKTILDDIPEISINQSDNSITLRMKKKNVEVISILASLDFAIIPLVSLDTKTNTIKNYKNTSGPYYVSHQGENVVFLPNKSHYNYSQEMPQKVIFIKNSYNLKNEKTLFFDKIIDLIPSSYNLFLNDLKDIADNNEQARLYKSADIKNFYIQFLPHLKNEISPQNRFFIGNTINNIFNSVYTDSYFYKDSKQFILNNGNGGVSPSEEKQIRELLENPNNTPPKKKLNLVLWVHSPVYQKVKEEISKRLPFLTLLTYTLDNLKKADLVIVSADVSSLDDSSFLHFNLKEETFGIKKEIGQKLYQEYSQLSSPIKKVEFFHNIHYQALSSGMLIPLISFPSALVVRNSWKLINQNPLSASQPLWNLRIQ